MAGNPNIAQCAIGYRFGEPGGADPSEASKMGARPYEIRRALKKIARTIFDVTEGAPTFEKQVRDIFGGEMSGAELAAVRKFMQAMKDYRAMENLTNDIDGKLVERRIESRVTLAELVTGSYESLESGEGDDSGVAD